MRSIATVLVCLSVVSYRGTVAIGTQSPAGGTDAAPVLAKARAALGGDAALSAIKSFTATGRTRRLQGDNLLPIEFEIACELPDRFVRKDEIPVQESGPTSRGFNGAALIQIPPPAMRDGGPPRGGPPGDRGGMPPPAGPAPPARPAGPAAFAPPKSDPVSTAKQEFVRLTLGMFATSFSAYPLSFVRAGQAQAPQGKAEVIDVTGPEGSNFKMRFLINAETGLPVLVSWQLPASNVVVTVPGQAQPTGLAPGTVVVEGPPVPAADAPKEQEDEFSKTVADLRRKAQATLVEHRLYYADYRDVGRGVQFPFRLRRAIGADTIEETNFDAFTLNPRIDPRKFEVVK